MNMIINPITSDWKMYVNVFMNFLKASNLCRSKFIYLYPLFTLISFKIYFAVAILNAYIKIIVIYPGWDRIYSIPEVLYRLILSLFSPLLERVSKPLFPSFLTVSDSSIPMIPWRGHFLMNVDASPPCGPLLHHHTFIAGSQVPGGGAASSFPS